MSSERHRGPGRSGPDGKLGDYEILRELETGGMGKVLLARKRAHGGFEKLCAIKLMRSELRAMEKVRNMFLDEARLLSRIEHPAVAQVYDFGDSDGALYLVMEYVAGVNFRALIDRRPDPGVAARLVAAACRGLHAAHELTDLAGRPLHVVHRDVSPENLMLTFDGHVKVLDFGIALTRDRRAPVTELGTIKGKPPYLSPEQVKNEAIDRRTDIFAACIVLHELLTGEAVFTGESIYAVAWAIENEDVAPPSGRCGALPAGLDDAVLRGVARDPALRYADAGQLADELECIAGAAGAESLASYAQRELRAAREAHREELARILASPEAEVDRSRATGVMTALAMTLPSHTAQPANAAQPGQAGKSEAAPAPDRDAAGSAPPDKHDADDLDRNLRMKRWPRIARVAVFLLVGASVVVSLGVWMRMRSTDAPTSGLAATQVVPVGPEMDPGVNPDMDPGTGPASEQAGEQTGGPATPPAPDIDPATSPSNDPAGDHPANEPSADAAQPSPGAGDSHSGQAHSRTRRSTTRRTGTSARSRSDPSGDQPAVTSPLPDEPAPRTPGRGKVTIVALGAYALVRIDGKGIGTTPIFDHELDAGPHEIVLSHPDSGQVRLERDIVIEPGKTVRIQAP